eukprot:46160_1
MLYWLALCAVVIATTFGKEQGIDPIIHLSSSMTTHTRTIRLSSPSPPLDHTLSVSSRPRNTSRNPLVSIHTDRDEEEQLIIQRRLLGSSDSSGSSGLAANRGGYSGDSSSSGSRDYRKRVFDSFDRRFDSRGSRGIYDSES